MGKSGMQRLRMLGPLLASAIDNTPYDHWDAGLSTVHVMPVRGLVDDGIHSIQHEIHPRVYDHGPHPCDCSAYGRRQSSHSLRQAYRDPAWSKTLKQTQRGVPHVPWTLYALAHQEYRRVRSHTLMQCFVDR